MIPTFPRGTVARLHYCPNTLLSDLAEWVVMLAPDDASAVPASLDRIGVASFATLVDPGTTQPRRLDVRDARNALDQGGVARFSLATLGDALSFIQQLRGEFAG